MLEETTIHIALENLKKLTGIAADWRDNPTNAFDGEIQFDFEGRRFAFNTVVKKEFRLHQLDQLLNKAKSNMPFMLCVTRIFPKIKEILRQNGVAWLEANGNVFFKHQGQTFWIETQKPSATGKNKTNRAFTKTGLKVVFQFLLDEKLINEKHRALAVKTKTALGNVNNVLNGLKESGFITEKDEKIKVLINKNVLLEKWISAFQYVLKPGLLMGTFRFLNEKEYVNWKEIHLIKGMTYWGGEPAADILTNYLRPGKFTIYTDESKSELMKNYRLIPDENGDIKVYKKFWDDPDLENGLVPTVLIYADLIGQDDKRCRETAQIIYNEYLKGKF